MSSLLICNAAFCENTRKKSSAWCSAHIWERTKYKVKPFKQIKLFNPKVIKKYEVTKEQTKLNNVKYAEKRKGWRLKKRYGIDLTHYQQLLESQNFSCRICLVKSNKENWQNDKTQYFDVDHNHETNQVRGLLCRRCNIFIGYIEKDIHLLDKIKEYLT